jgi:hypothetical protein
MVPFLGEHDCETAALSVLQAVTRLFSVDYAIRGGLG